MQLCGYAYAGLPSAFDGSLARVSAQVAEHLSRIEELKESAGTPRTTAGFTNLQSNLEALQTLLDQLMHVNVSICYNTAIQDCQGRFHKIEGLRN